MCYVDTAIEPRLDAMGQSRSDLLVSAIGAALSGIDFIAADEGRRAPDNLFPSLARLGLFGLVASPAYGGLGLGLRDASEAIATTAAFDASAASALTIHNLLALTCIEQADHLPGHPEVMRAAALGASPCAFALTEPEAGSSPRHIRATVSDRDGHLVLNGSKIWIGLGEWATWTVCFAKRGDGPHRGEFVSLLVDMTSPGVTVLPQHLTSGLRGIVQNPLRFVDAEIPEAFVLSRHGDGWALASRGMNGGRIGVASMAIGSGERCLQTALCYVRSRVVSNRLLGAYRHVQDRLATMAVRLALMRLLRNEACLAAERDPTSLMPLVLKVMATEWCSGIIDGCVQVMGGRGFDDRMLVSRFYRDSRIFRIFEGPTETLLSHVARSFRSRATAGEIEAQFAGLGAADLHAEVEAALVLTSADRDDPVQAGWLVASALVLAVARSRARSTDVALVEAEGLAEADYREQLRRARAMVPRREARGSALLDDFQARAARTLRTPVFAADKLRIVGFE